MAFFAAVEELDVVDTFVYIPARLAITIIILAMVIVIVVASRQSKKNYHDDDRDNLPRNGNANLAPPSDSALSDSTPAFDGVSHDNNEMLADSDAEVLEAIRRYDPDFSKPDFEDWLGAFLGELFLSYREWDLVKLHNLEYDSLYEDDAQHIEELRAQGHREVREGLNIMRTVLADFKIDKHFEYLTVMVRASAREYTLDAHEAIISNGGNARLNQAWYKMRFLRTKGDKSLIKPGESRFISCPNCGATIATSSGGICEYCGTNVILGRFNWLLVDFKVRHLN
ncbi:MAG: TIM44-like domain-containing protein [Coriobacteriales bacterium]|jgi:hypothetical protein|nr:TIM44-like domain-containing protein [Coriobacteriales bacterium]